jgi:hypothetical protein
MPRGIEAWRYIYFIQGTLAPSVKIGVTSDIDGRLAAPSWESR